MDITNIVAAKKKKGFCTFSLTYGMDILNLHKCSRYSRHSGERLSKEVVINIRGLLYLNENYGEESQWEQKDQEQILPFQKQN